MSPFTRSTNEDIQEEQNNAEEDHEQHTDRQEEPTRVLTRRSEKINERSEEDSGGSLALPLAKEKPRKETEKKNEAEETLEDKSNSELNLLFIDELLFNNDVERIFEMNSFQREDLFIVKENRRRRERRSQITKRMEFLAINVEDLKSLTMNWDERIQF